MNDQLVVKEYELSYWEDTIQRYDPIEIKRFHNNVFYSAGDIVARYGGENSSALIIRCFQCLQDVTSGSPQTNPNNSQVDTQYWKYIDKVDTDTFPNIIFSDYEERLKKYEERVFEIFQALSSRVGQGYGFKQSIEETKLFIFGGNDVNSHARAQNVKLKRNINGSNSLTFDMYYRYPSYSEFDPKSKTITNGQMIDNPFVSKLQVEAKVKLRLGDPKQPEWLDFIIKKIEEDSEQGVYHYTCNDLFINELSRNGYNIGLSEEQHNNMGTAQELMKTILENSEWELDEANSDVIRQYVDEPIYKIDNPALIRERLSPLLDKDKNWQNSVYTDLYLFQSSAINAKEDIGNIVQFLAVNPNNIELDANECITNGIQLYYAKTSSNTIWSFSGTQFPTSIFGSSFTLNTQYKAKRLVKSQITEYEPILDRYVTVWKNGLTDIYRYEESEFKQIDINKLLITDTEDFKYNNLKLTQTIDGTSKQVTYTVPENWYDDWYNKRDRYGSGVGLTTITTENGVQCLDAEIKLGSVPVPYFGTSISHALLGDSLDFGEYIYSNIVPYYDQNIISQPSSDPTKTFNRFNSLLNGVGCEIRLLSKTTNEVISFVSMTTQSGLSDTNGWGNDFSALQKSNAKFFIGKIEEDILPETYYTSDKKGYNIIKIAKDYSFIFVVKLNNTFGLSSGIHAIIKSIEVKLANTYYKGTEETAFVKYFTTDEETEQSLLERLDNAKDYYGLAQELKFYYYYRRGYDSNTGDNTIKYLYKGPNLQTGKTLIYNTVHVYTNAYNIPQYYNDCPKITSVNIEKSNRFNAITSICEAFECWPVFTIEHELDGRIKSSNSERIFSPFLGTSAVVSSIYNFANTIKAFGQNLYKFIHDGDLIKLAFGEYQEDYVTLLEGLLGDLKSFNIEVIDIINNNNDFEEKVKEIKEMLNFRFTSLITPFTRTINGTTKRFNAILSVGDYKPQTKKIAIKELVKPETNQNGFKYGTNLDSIKRTISSEQISTVIIVEDYVNDISDGGFCSIAKAPSNYSKENAVINLDYYVQAGFIDRAELMKDLYGSNLTENICYEYQMHLLNTKLDYLLPILQAYAKETANIESLASVYSAAVDANIKEIEDKVGIFSDYFGDQFKLSYNKIVAAIYEAVNKNQRENQDSNGFSGNLVIDGIANIADFLKRYVNKTTGVDQSIVQSPSNAVNWASSNRYQSHEVGKIVFYEGEYYICNTALTQVSGSKNVYKKGQVINCYGTAYKCLQDCTNSEGLAAQTFIENNPTLFKSSGSSYPGAQIYWDKYDMNTSEDYTYFISRKNKDYTVNLATSDNAIQIFKWIKGYMVDAASSVLSYTLASSRAQVIQEGYKATLRQYDELVHQKRNVYDKLFAKYGRYMQEGTWASQNYVDDDAYYMDALSVAVTSSRPQITYDINVIDVEVLGGEYSKYKFEVGQKTFVQDDTFFGIDTLTNKKWNQEVIISEIEYDFDHPENTHITVQNYQTRFEDLFQRVAAAVQSVEYTGSMYNKITEVIRPNGEIALDSLQQTIKNNGIAVQYAKNQEVTWDSRGITVKEKGNPRKILRIIAGGIYTSSDGGATYVNAVSSDGISASILTSGVLNTSQIVIANGTQASFRWDAFGLNAYCFDEEEAQYTSSVMFKKRQHKYDMFKFVRFDQYGVYGIDLLSERNLGGGYSDALLNWTPRNVNDIHSMATFGLTWNGFFFNSDSSVSDRSVRLDKYGLYGLNNINNLATTLKELESIEDSTIDKTLDTKVANYLQYGNADYKKGEPVNPKAKYGLLWDRFFFLGGKNGSSTTIDDEGIHITDSNGNDLFSVSEDGDLTIKGKITATSLQIGSSEETIQDFTEGVIKDVIDVQIKENGDIYKFVKNEVVYTNEEFDKKTQEFKHTADEMVSKYEQETTVVKNALEGYENAVNEYGKAVQTYNKEYSSINQNYNSISTRVGSIETWKGEAETTYIKHSEIQQLSDSITLSVTGSITSNLADNLKLKNLLINSGPMFYRTNGLPSYTTSYITVNSVGGTINPAGGFPHGYLVVNFYPKSGFKYTGFYFNKFSDFINNKYGIKKGKYYAFSYNITLGESSEISEIYVHPSYTVRPDGESFVAQKNNFNTPVELGKQKRACCKFQAQADSNENLLIGVYLRNNTNTNMNSTKKIILFLGDAQLEEISQSKYDDDNFWGTEWSNNVLENYSTTDSVEQLNQYVDAKLKLYVELDEKGQLQSNIDIGANKLTIKTNNFTLDGSGNVTAKNINATGGYIAGWKIDDTALTKLSNNYLMRLDSVNGYAHARQFVSASILNGANAADGSIDNVAKSDILSCIENSPLFKANTNYTVGTILRASSNYYCCEASRTYNSESTFISNAILIQTKFLTGNSTEIEVEYSSSAPYVTGQIVTYNGDCYIAKVSTSPETFKSSKWIKLSNLTTTIQSASSKAQEQAYSGYIHTRDSYTTNCGIGKPTLNGTTFHSKSSELWSSKFDVEQSIYPNLQHILFRTDVIPLNEVRMNTKYEYYGKDQTDNLGIKGDYRGWHIKIQGNPSYSDNVGNNLVNGEIDKSHTSSGTNGEDQDKNIVQDIFIGTHKISTNYQNNNGVNGRFWHVVALDGFQPYENYSNGTGTIAYNTTGPALFCSSYLMCKWITTNKVRNNSLLELKTNIKKSQEVLPLLKNSDIYSFNYKTDTEVKPTYGFIIGEGYKTPKELIDDDGAAINLYSMAALNWKASQEILDRVEKIENYLKI